MGLPMPLYCTLPRYVGLSCIYCILLRFLPTYQEIPTLESGRLRAAFTEKDLKDMEAQLMKIILKDVSFVTTLPMGLLCHDKSTAP